MNIKKDITKEDLKLIFGNFNDGDEIAKNAVKSIAEVLAEYKGKETPKRNFFSFIVENYDYNVFLKETRSIFRQTEKYKKMKESKSKFEKENSYFIKKWGNSGIKDCGTSNLEQVCNTIMRKESIPYEDREEEVGRITRYVFARKYLNTLRNDTIEYLVFENNEGVIPTFGNKKGLDFLINGIGFDQKVSKSVGKAFITKMQKEYRDWKEEAVLHPELVAKSLYENQQRDRFGAEPRLLIINLEGDDNIDFSHIKDKVSNLNVNNTLKIEFEFPNLDKTLSRYNTEALVLYI